MPAALQVAALVAHAHARARGDALRILLLHGEKTLRGGVPIDPGIVRHFDGIDLVEREPVERANDRRILCDRDLRRVDALRPKEAGVGIGQKLSVAQAALDHRVELPDASRHRIPWIGEQTR